jgi:hypothetical protein
MVVVNDTCVRHHLHLVKMRLRRNAERVESTADRHSAPTVSVARTRRPQPHHPAAPLMDHTVAWQAVNKELGAFGLNVLRGWSGWVMRLRTARSRNPIPARGRVALPSR